MASTVTELTSRETLSPARRWRSSAAVAGAVLAAALLTALVFLQRAGSETGDNWPVYWELRSSDNGVLFQLLQDVATGRPLDWSFSPQVYVFPELPVSALAFLLASGDVYWYYLLVAVINNMLLFGIIVAVLRLVCVGERLRTVLIRAAVAWSPLLILPWLGTSWLFSFHLAPTYYFGMYAALLVAPALYFARSRWARAAVAIALALVAASNPLVLVFTVPPLVVCALVIARSHGARVLVRPGLWLALALGVALVVRLAAFSSLQGTSPLSYVNVESFQARLAVLWPFLLGEFANPVTAVGLVAGATSAIACFVVALWALGRWRATRYRRLLVVGWAGLVPLVGLASTAVLLITHQLYLWPVLVLPIVVILAMLPARTLPVVGVIAAACSVLAIAVGATNLGHTDRYFGFRNPETQCLDERLPRGSEIGYSTFSDARRLSLTSQRGVRLIPLKSDGSEAPWLANTDYVRADIGRFFYINFAGDEPAIDPAFIEREFGAPDRVIRCDVDRELWLFDSPAKITAIADHFGVRQ